VKSSVEARIKITDAMNILTGIPFNALKLVRAIPRCFKGSLSHRPIDFPANDRYCLLRANTHWTCHFAISGWNDQSPQSHVRLKSNAMT
jgi:hypothetical protein